LRRHCAITTAASLDEVSRLPGRHDDQTLILADVGRKAIRQVEVRHGAARAAVREPGAGA
jgi:hypothetical protein